MTGRTRAVVANHDAVTRVGIRWALERARIAVVEEVADAAGAVRAARRHRPDVCLVAARISGGGIGTVAEIAAASPETHVIVLLESGAEDEGLAALRAGASGCLLEDVGAVALGRAVHATLNGEASLPRALTADVIEELQRGWHAGRTRTATGTWATLSSRETEVLRLMHRRLTTKQIAERLGISTVTVRRHVSDTVRRLGVRDRDAALRLTGPARAGGPAPRSSPRR